MQKAVILAGGTGNRCWPYNETRNKGMIPIANKPILVHTVDNLVNLGFTEITIIGSYFCQEIKHTFRNAATVTIKEIKPTLGSSETLLAFEAEASNDFFVFFGDCLICPEDLHRFIESEPSTVLLDEARDNAHNHIVARLSGNEVQDFIAHPRGMERAHYLVGLHADTILFHYLEHNPGKFLNTKVGVGSPNECFLEQSLNDYLEDFPLDYLVCNEPSFDIDKPWQILEANAYWNEKLCTALRTTFTKEGAVIDESAQIDGFVMLGKNSRIGKNVHIKGNCIIGDNTIIDYGATIDEFCVIGDRCIIQNYCKVGSHTTIGHDCIIEQTAEMLGGMLMRKDYLYHHGEFYGLCGECVDLGAGSVCGTLRFDDGESTHVIQGRKERPTNYANATYLGDYCRSGVGVIFQPGAMVGCNSVIGSGVVLNQKVASNKLIYLKQELIETEWSVNKYGW